jgi:glycosyltransferase involved in cell wall biosynthesis
MRYLGVSEHKIAVTYNGIQIPPPAVEKTPEEVEQRFGISRPYLLHLGNFLPHKNFATLVKAYNLLKNRNHIPHRLVLAGKNDRLREQLEMLIAAEHLQEDVILTGFVEDEWVPSLYAHADLFVYPSVYEGFGLQALEAMAYKIPVVVSNVSSLPEIAGDAALQFDPLSTENMADTIYKVLMDKGLRTAVIEKGTQRVQQFSWREMARKTAEIYQDVKREA